jgi:ferredoxin-NADP reductase
MYSVKLKTRYNVAKDAIAFEFEKPIGFEFIPGQFTRISQGENTKTFSIASAPYEEILLFAMRKGSSDFKKSLANLQTGSKVAISKAMGRFLLHEDETIPAVFLVGGIGITPVRSILRSSSYRELKHKFYLFYSNKKPEGAPFLQEMQKIEGLDYKFIGTITDLENSKQELRGERGYINSAMIKKYIKDVKLPIYYIVGPPTFVRDTIVVLEDLGVDKTKIKQEMFGGYNKS